MRVQVERRRRGRRKPEIEYVEAAAPRKRPEAPQAAPGPWRDRASRALNEGVASNLRLPWRINRRDAEGT